MRHSTLSRRKILKQFVSMSAIGALNMLRIPSACANTSTNSSDRAIPGFQGNVIDKSHADYEIWRQAMVWHHSKPGRYPDIIVQASSEQDVIAAVNYAAKNNHKIAVRSGGHNSTGPSLRNEGMVLSVAPMNDLQIDAGRKIAAVQPGVLSIQLVQAARKKNLSFPVPHCPSVGLGGFTMGGGIGWNYSSTGGMSTFSITAADIVTADGQLRHASPGENPDLYWAVRGAGPGFFGVVTRLYLKLYPVPKAIHANSYILPLAKLDQATRALDKLVEIKNDRVEVLAIFSHHPALPADAPPEQSKILFISAFAFGDSKEESTEMLKPFSRSTLGTESLVKEENQPFSFESLYNKFFSLEVPAGMMGRYKVDNVMTDEPRKVLMDLADHFLSAPSAHAHVLAGYDMNMKVHEDACFSSYADCYLGCYAIWEDESEDDINYEWLEKCIPIMEPYAKGHYVNEVEPRFDPDRTRKCYSREAWQRLEQLRAKYDPDGVFHHYLREG